MRPSTKLTLALLAGAVAGIGATTAVHAAATPHAYIVAMIDVHDAAAYRSYAQGAAQIIAQHGGRYLARGGATKTVEGEAPPNRVAIIEFPSMEALEKFESSPEYTKIKAVRQRAATSRIFAVEGVTP